MKDDDGSVKLVCFSFDQESKETFLTLTLTSATKIMINILINKKVCLGQMVAGAAMDVF